LRRRGGGYRLFPDSRFPSQPVPAKAAGTLVPQQRKPVRAQPTGEQPLTFKVLPTPPDSKPIAPPPPVSFRLPSPWEVLPGAERSDLVDTYGAPALEASTQDSGHMFETLVYRNDRYQSIIHLEDGKVLGVSLKDSPQYSRR
jgi:hypothetical protein